MKDNREYTREELISLNKTRMLFIGFMIGIIPFLLLISIISFNEGGINHIPNIFKTTIIICGFITASINSITFQRMCVSKIK